MTATLGNRELSVLGQPAWMLWAVSFGVWAFISLADAGSIYELYRSTGGIMSFQAVLGMQSSQVLTYFPLTPFVFALAIHYPIQRGNWLQRSLLYLAGGLVFTMAHITLRGLTPYAYWDAPTHAWSSAIWDSQVHVFRIRWPVFGQLFLRNFVDDITETYVPIVLVAYAVAYYRRFRERQLRASQLEAQLANARLQALKSQLQPHFLFNTLHSISALMLTDVPSADKMMTRLSDLLRMSFEDVGTQVTTLSREIEFVNVYLEIEQIRFEDRLNIIFDIVPETLDAEVPHLLLQPLVENALRHGISRLSSGGEIRIAASHDENTLHLLVRDNGPGLGDGDAHPSEAGLGLKATRERLETIFGDAQTFDVSSPVEGGVEAWVRIPFRLHEVPSIHEIVPGNSVGRL